MTDDTVHYPGGRVVRGVRAESVIVDELLNDSKALDAVADG